MSAREKTRSRHPWRENIEALTMAIAVALLFKYFILEISKIPSGSMQPTLMGSPETSIFDRVLVDKLSYRFRDPERFEIVVFKHPLERSRVMVKRLVGMPGEELRIEHGDLWTRPLGGGGDWELLRRPPALQRAMWRTLEVGDRRRSSPWAQEEGSAWSIQARSIEARGPGRARYRPDDESVRDLYTDGYPDSLRAEIGNRGRRESGRHAVGDLRLEGEVEALAGTESVVLTLTEGDQTYSFALPGPAGDLDAPRIDRSTSGATGDLASAVAEAPWRLSAGDTARFAVENLDDRLTLEVDEERLVTLGVDPQARQESSVTIEVRGEGARLDDLMVHRDIYYYWPERAPGQAPWQVEIPERSYVMLGDNTQDSADGRAWEFVTYSWTDGDEARTERGNYRWNMAQGNPLVARFDGDEPGWAFRDEWGELHWFEQSRVTAGPIPGAPRAGTADPLVPRELIQGRALAVFWPLEIGRRMWRLGWLH